MSDLTNANIITLAAMKRTGSNAERAAAEAEIARRLSPMHPRMEKDRQETTSEGAALRGSHQASAEKVMDTPPIAPAEKPTCLIPPAEPSEPSTDTDELEDQIKDLKKRVERLHAVADAASIIAVRALPSVLRQPGSEEAPAEGKPNTARIKTCYFQGDRRLRGFRFTRTRDGKTEVEHHLFDDNSTAVARVTESLRLGFEVQTDTELAIEFMRRWPTERMHLWAKVPDGWIEAHSFDRSDAGYAAMHRWIDGRQGRFNIYFVVNDIDPKIILGVTKRVDPKNGELKIILKPRETDMIRMVAAHVDSDFRPLLNATDDERAAHNEAERNRIISRFESHEPKFNVVTLTGGGGQAFQLFQKPVAIDQDVAKITEGKRVNVHLKGTLDGSDDCESLDHVMRLVGTVNVPEAKKRKRGRVPALAYCVRFDDRDQWHDANALPKSMAKATGASKEHEAARESTQRESRQRDNLSPMSSSGSAGIAEQLNARMADLAHELLGAPNEALSGKTQLRYGTKGSIAIEIDGPKAGCWYDHESGAGGDALELLHRHKQLANDEAVEWARQWLGTLRGDAKSGEPGTANQADESADANAAADAPPSDDAAARDKKVADILASSGGIAETPAELYLHNRGITTAAPDCIRFRRLAFKQYGAMVALATDAEGKVLALQQIYLTDGGQKAPLAIVKRTNKAVDGWAEKSAVRLPGTLPLILAEGPETALSIWQATGHETWACLGIANIGRAPVPEGADVIIARDGDELGSKADRQIRKAGTALVQRGHSVLIATPPVGEDFNDVLGKQGAEAIRKLIDSAEPAIDAGLRQLGIGSDVEIGQRVRADLIERFDRIIHAEGAFWRYGGTHWEPIANHELRRAVHAYDGARFYSPAGDLLCVKLNRGRIDSVLNECATLCFGPDFFDERPTGINCASGFIRFADDGSAAIEPHHRDHRCRHTLPGRWDMGANGRPPEGSLLFRLLDGVFEGDAEAAEKIALLSEVCGSAALGHATKLKQPRAVILFGQTAENGKSQILDLGRGLLPPNAICSVPAGRMGDERHIVGLVGKLLNATDELSSAAVASDTFKSVVTGEPVEGRDVYKSRIEFRSMAQNLFATNGLPPFLGGMDRGVQRRLLVVPFNRTIPFEQRIENIGRRIAKEEADLLLAWAVDGASRLVRQRNFTVPQSCKQALTEWICSADPVLAWLAGCVEVRPVIDGQPAITTRETYTRFHAWAVAEGFKTDKLPAINGFVQRVLANAAGVEHHRNAHGRRFLGLVIKGLGDTVLLLRMTHQ